jgi:hypothetical protein
LNTLNSKIYFTYNKNIFIKALVTIAFLYVSNIFSGNGEEHT